MMARRAVLSATVLSLVSLAAALATAGPASAQTPGLVVDAGSGRVLFAERATDPWYPASITKLMTVYVALDQVRRGRLAMNSLLTMSEYAASQPPSKLGLQPGGQLTLENAIRIIMVKSANDVATLIGEGVGGGSVEGFAALMNEASQRLGMHESRWYNPSGLPDGRQQTSARDMALLARALINEFPDRQDLFNIGAVKLGATVMRNHNGLLGRYPGADGMKTGFICSGGFNVVATATQGGRRLITVVMGYPSARERDLRTADLFDTGFSSFGGGWSAQSIDSLPPSASMAAPDMRSVICGPKRRTPQEDDETAAVQVSAANNAENPIASLFSSSPFGSTANGAPILGSRRTLGPRVAFEPIPVWIGATPGEVGDEVLSRGRGRRLRIAGPRVRTERVSRASAPGPAALAFTSGSATPSIIAGAKVDTVKAGLRPASRSALRDNLGTSPSSDVKPRLGAIGSTASGRPTASGSRPGAIAAKPAAVDGVNPDTTKLKTTSGRTTAGRTAQGRTPQDKPAAKPKPKPVASQ